MGDGKVVVARSEASCVCEGELSCVLTLVGERGGEYVLSRTSPGTDATMGMDERMAMLPRTPTTEGRLTSL